MPYKVNEKRRHKIPKARYRVKNWRDYDAALRRRGDLTVWVTAAAIGGMDAASQWPAWSTAAILRDCVETGLMLRLAFGRPWRQTEGMLASIMRLLGLDLPVPDHTTFSRRSADLTVAKAVSTASWAGERGDRLHRPEGIWGRRMAAREAWRQRAPDLAQVPPCC